jgi:drug/metabolite transporter (DMT)-like permease
MAYLPLIATGTFSAISLVFWTLAFQNDKSAFISSLGYIQLVYALLLDVLMFDVEFSYPEIIGSSLIVFFLVINVSSKLRAEK